MPTPPSSPRPLRRAVMSSYFGSLIEYYDFMLYGTASAVVFGKVFFSSLDPLVGTIASFGTLATGYVARPLGGIVFGHFGDRLGRKKMLVLSMIMMGVASVLIGVLPTYASIGIWAPALLVFLRVIQGVAVGGEWGGAVLMSVEHAHSRRGLWASFTTAGAPSGILLSTAVLTATSAWLGDTDFIQWGWRIPFLLSAVLLIVGLVVRAKVTEPPVFEQAQGKLPRRPPLVEVLRHHPRNLLLAIGVAFGASVAQGVMTTFMIAFAVQAGFQRQTVLNASTLAAAVTIFGILGFAALSDRVGRRPVLLFGALSAAVWMFVLFPLVESGSTALLTVGLVVGQGVILSALAGPTAALLPELFPTSVRYTGASLGNQIAILGAGFAPLTFTAILNAGGGTILITAIAAAALALTALSILTLRETSKAPLKNDEAVETEVATNTV